jgi:hypothetical protein
VANHVQGGIHRIVDMRYLEFLEYDNQVENTVTGGNQISFLAKDHDASPDTKSTSQPQKVSHATKRECLILSRNRDEWSTKKRFVCLLDKESSVDQEAILRHHHSR